MKQSQLSRLRYLTLPPAERARRDQAIADRKVRMRAQYPPTITPRPRKRSR